MVRFDFYKINNDPHFEQKPHSFHRSDDNYARLEARAKHIHTQTHLVSEGDAKKRIAKIKMQYEAPSVQYSKVH